MYVDFTGDVEEGVPKRKKTTHGKVSIMYICEYLYIYTHIYTHTHICVCLCVFVCV
jgi:hypothetical protein